MADEKELKDQRVPIMMTPSELEAIDDWMFKNRIRSRGEAIRRLCRVGLEADEGIDKLTDEMVGLSDAIFALLHEDSNRTRPLSREVMKNLFRLMDSHAAVFVPAGIMRRGKIEEALANAAEWKERLKEPDAFNHAGKKAREELLARSGEGALDLGATTSNHKPDE
jgi:hypothetical protein